MNEVSIFKINEALERGSASFMEETDREYYDRIESIADAVIEKGSPVILLSGPSGSGKTTTAHMLELILDEKGHESHTISLDNYFISLTEEEKILVAKGEMDLETPTRINSDVLSSQILKIVSCEEVEFPAYDFKEAKSVPSGLKLKRREGEIVIFEGTHALNPSVISVPDEETFKIYISVRTRVSDKEGALHPSRIRLLRRMLRDKRTRGRLLLETLSMYESVEEGENKYIMPYKHRADIEADSFIPYEVNVYASALLSDLHAAKEEFLCQDASCREFFPISDAAESVLHELSELLSSACPVSVEEVPKDSLIREFIG